MNLGHWILSEGVNYTENVFGFIYEIKNTVTGKMYIGKKQCCSKIKRKPLKGKRRNRIEYKESDWRTYTGSSVDLNNDIEKYGKDSFIFTIIKICDSKWALAYYEIKEQIERDVIMCDNFYNGILNVRIGRPPKSEFDKIKKETTIVVND
jgi:hypothetical protein